MGGGNLFQRQLEKPHLRGVVLALILALLISIYSTLDGTAVKHTSALSYAVNIFFLIPVFTTPLMFQHFGWQVLKTELTSHWLRLAGIGLLMVSAYMLVMLAYSVSPVGYVGAIREVSVVLGALDGWRFLGERMGGWRVTGSLVIFCGILVITFIG